MKGIDIDLGFHFNFYLFSTIEQAEKVKMDIDNSFGHFRKTTLIYRNIDKMLIYSEAEEVLFVAIIDMDKEDLMNMDYNVFEDFLDGFFNKATMLYLQILENNDFDELINYYLKDVKHNTDNVKLPFLKELLFKVKKKLYRLIFFYRKTRLDHDSKMHEYKKYELERAKIMAGYLATISRNLN